MAKLELDNPLIVRKVQVARSGVQGFGVYAIEDIEADQLVEECPVVLMKRPPRREVYDFVFNWDDNYVGFALGYGSIYNHSEQNNIRFELNKDLKTISYISNRKIERGEEIFINYGARWFEIHGKEDYQKKGGFSYKEVRAFIVILMILLIVLFAVGH